MSSSSSEGFRARTSATPDDGPASEVSGPGSGPGWRPSFAYYDPDGCCWRTWQQSLVEGWDEFSETWPRSGTTRSGIAYRLPASVPLTSVTDGSRLPTPSASSYGTNQSPSPGAAVRPSLETMARNGLWPTPTTKDSIGARNFRADGTPYDAEGRFGPTLTDVVRGFWPTPKGSASHYGQPREDDWGDLQAVLRWPTPTARDGASGPGQAASSTGGPNLRTVIGGALNPTWVEWLIGLPLGWTELPDSPDSATP